MNAHDDQGLADMIRAATRAGVLPARAGAERSSLDTATAAELHRLSTELADLTPASNDQELAAAEAALGLPARALRRGDDLP